RSLQRQHGRIWTNLFSYPPHALTPVGGEIGHVITIENRTQEAGRPLRKRGRREQADDRRRSLEQPPAKTLKPRGLIVRAERGEPHLPIEPRLVWCNPGGSTSQIARFVFELVRQPIGSVVGPFDDDFRPRGGHHRKESVAVDAMERLGEG